MRAVGEQCPQSLIEAVVHVNSQPDESHRRGARDLLRFVLDNGYVHDWLGYDIVWQGTAGIDEIIVRNPHAVAKFNPPRS